MAEQNSETIATELEMLNARAYFMKTDNAEEQRKAIEIYFGLGNKLDTRTEMKLLRY